MERTCPARDKLRTSAHERRSSLHRRRQFAALHVQPSALGQRRSSRNGNFRRREALALGNGPMVPAGQWCRRSANGGEMNVLTVGGAMVDTIVTIASDKIEQIKLRNAESSFLLLEEGQ